MGGFEDEEIDGLEELVYQQAIKAQGKTTKRNPGDQATERMGDIEKYINSDFELVAETSLQAFTNPMSKKNKKH